MAIRRGPLPGSIALVLGLVFVVTLITVHLIEPEINFGPISLYSLGAFGFVMRFGFVVLGVAFFVLGWGLVDQTKHTALLYLDEALVMTAGGGLVLVGLFNTDPAGAVQTVHGLIHSYSAVLWSVAVSLGMVLFALAFRYEGSPLVIGRLSRNLAIAAVSVFVSGFFSYGTFFGPIQPRLFFAIVAAWLLLIASQLRLGRFVISRA